MNCSASQKIKSDDIYALIAKGSLFVDLRETHIHQPEKVKVFANSEIADAFSFLKPTKRPVLKTNTITLEVGFKIILYETVWAIIVKTPEGLVLHSDKSQEHIKLSFEKIDELLDSGHLKALEKDSSKDLKLQASGKIQLASEKDLKKATEICRKIQPFLRGETECASELPSRTLRNYIKKYKDSEELDGYGFLGLLPKTSGGNSKRKIPDEVATLMAEVIETVYETLKNRSKKSVYGELILRCKEKGFHAPSFKTFLKAIASRRLDKQVEKMGGKRMAYGFQEHYRGTETWARHGDYPFHVGHIDHTELDIELVCPETGQNLGRPWLTILPDAYSRKIICHVLSFDRPSYRSCLQIIRRCVQMHNRFFSTLVTDNGKEFESAYFEKLLSRMEVIDKKRPPSEARYGAVCERFFRTTNTQFVYTLAGNTQLSKNVRQLTGKVNPKKQAVWTLKDLDECITEYFYEIYNKQVHSSLHQSPDDKFANGMEKFGERVAKRIEYNEDFLIFSMPTISRGDAKVDYNRGVKIRSLYYWTDCFRDPKVAGQRVEIKYDPFDIGTAYVFVNKQWEKCHSDYYHKLQGYTEQEIRFISETVRQKNKLMGRNFKISGIRLAEMIRRNEEKEMDLKKRLDAIRHKENKRVLGLPEKKQREREMQPKAATHSETKIETTVKNSKKIYEVL